jgi:hypothetical protein
MTEALMNTLTDYGALGLFAMYLIYNSHQLQKRMDDLLAKFTEDTKAFETKSEEREEKLRDRYDAVIAKYDKERIESFGDFGKALTEMDKKIEFGLAEIQKVVEEARMRELARRSKGDD